MGKKLCDFVVQNYRERWRKKADCDRFAENDINRRKGERKAAQGEGDFRPSFPKKRRRTELPKKKTGGWGHRMKRKKGGSDAGRSRRQVQILKWATGGERKNNRITGRQRNPMP